jgi:monoamine oxidase
MNTDHDVTIIGAGLAGLSCARMLNEKGISFLLLEGSIQGAMVSGRRAAEALMKDLNLAAA